MSTELLRSARRILVVGCSGAGKSTLSRALSDRLGLRHISMDREFFWLAGWKLRDRQEIRRLIGEAVAGERWIIDGNSPGTLDLRLPRADLVIWLRLPRLLCLRRILARRIRFAGRNRPDMADGCPERIDADFLAYIWYFERKESPEIAKAIETHGEGVPVLVLRTTSEVDGLLARLGPSV